MRRLITYYLLVGVYITLLEGCKEKRGEALFTHVTNSGIGFVNAVADSKEENSFYFRNFYNGGGVAIGDINNDKLADVVLTSNMGENKLYQNKGDFTFEDITAKSGFRQDSLWNTGVVMADINADGWLDIYLCSSGNMRSGKRKNKLYINNKNLSFTESAASYGLDHSGYCTQASFFDYDLDGDLDCLLINNSPLPFSSLNYASMRDVDVSQWNVDENLKGGGNHLYRNDDGYYHEVTAEAGLHTGLISFGLGVSVGDVNQDSYPDIYVGNDFIEKDYLYINQGNGKFSDELEQRLQQISMSSMSTDLADINNDGLPEIFTTDMIPDDDYRLKTTGTFDNIDLYLSKKKAGLYNQYVKNSLQLNTGNGYFSDISYYSGVSGTDWSWGAVFLDADNDGLNDIFVCNGINKDVGDLDFLDFFSNDVYTKMVETGKKEEVDELLKKIPSTPLANRVFRNLGSLKFADTGEDWGLSQPAFSNSVAYGDLDNDGDLDLVVNNANSPAFIYRNNSRKLNQHNYFSVELKGIGKNSFAVGSKLMVYEGTQVYSRELFPSRGYQSSVDYRLVVGLGKLKQVDSAIIIWPGGTYSRFIKPAINTVHTWTEPINAEIYSFNKNREHRPSLLSRDSSYFQKHTEDEYTDFYYERNLPAMLSREGPGFASADVNGDGNEDVFIGGASGQTAQLYLQTSTGHWKLSEQPGFELFKEFEDVAAAFFDADQDGDQDLFVGSGGNKFRSGDKELEHRLYRNDGKGKFSLDPTAFPGNNLNISTGAPFDFDGDGDQDLFIGSRSIPFSYGLLPQSYIYVNDGSGHFKPAVNGPAITGMVTAAVWANVAGDVNKELIVTGEWMHPLIYSYANGKWTQLTGNGLQDLWGMWQSIAAADLNDDGYEDLLLGNIGENFYLRPQHSKPAKLWLADFDANGEKEQVITSSINDRDMPVFLKREVTEQFPGLKKANLRHSDYARRSIQDLFGNAMKNSVERKFNFNSSVIAYGNGKGQFRVKPLPAAVQLSSANAFVIADLNGDKKKDIVLGGNLFTFPPQFGRLDASNGSVLLAGPNESWSVMTTQSSGLMLRGSIKHIRVLGNEAAARRKLIVIQNDLKPEIFIVTDGVAP